VIEEDKRDDNYELLQHNLRQLKTMRLLNGRQLNIVELPMPPELLFRQAGQEPEVFGPVSSTRNRWLRALRAPGLALALIGGLLATAGSASAQSVQVVVSGPVVHAPPPPPPPRVVVQQPPVVVVRPAPRVVVAPPPPTRVIVAPAPQRVVVVPAQPVRVYQPPPPEPYYHGHGHGHGWKHGHGWGHGPGPGPGRGPGWGHGPGHGPGWKHGR